MADVALDYLMTVGASRWAKSSVSLTTVSPAQVSALDGYNQKVTGGSDPATGVEAEIGGKYVAMGGSDATDFEIEDTGHTLQRTAKEDAGTGFGQFNQYKGRAIGLDTNMANTAFCIDVSYSGTLPSGSNNILTAQMVRVAGEDDYVIAYVEPVTSADPDAYTLIVRGFSSTEGGTQLFAGSAPSGSMSGLAKSPFRMMTMVVGEEVSVFIDRGITGTYTKMLSVSSPELGPGGLLEKGDVYIFDQNTGKGECTRTYDNLLAWEPDHDAVLFSGQTSRFRSSDGIRENAAGDAWLSLPDYEGARMRVPQAGGRGLTSRLSVKARRGNVAESNDDTIDDKLEISGTITPRVLLLG